MEPKKTSLGPQRQGPPYKRPPHDPSEEESWPSQPVSIAVVKELIRQAKQVGLEDDPAVMRRIGLYGRTADPQLLEALKHQFARARPNVQALVNPFWSPKLTESSLDPDGVPMGEAEHPRGGRTIRILWPRKLIMLAAVALGDIGSGKTNAGLLLALKLVECGYSVVIFDVRFDWLGLIRHLPKAVLITPKTDRFNLIGPLPGVNLWDVFQDFSQVLCEATGLYTASKLFLQEALAELAEKARTSGEFPHLRHLRDAVVALPARDRTPRADYKERVLERLDGLINTCGPEMLFVQQGYPLEQMIQDGYNIIFYSPYDTQMTDLLVFLRLRRLFLRRRNADHISHRPVVIFLDEFRSLLGRGGLRGSYQ